MRKTRLVVLLAMIFSILSTSGCSPYVENNKIEEIAPVIFWSLNDGGKGKLQISTIVPPLIDEKKSLLTMKVNLLKEGGKDFNLNYFRELKSGQLRIMFINEKLVENKGIMSLINTITLDTNISQRLYLVIVKGDFDSYIKNQIKKQKNLDYLIYRMFKHYERNNQGEMTVVNLHQFMNKAYSRYSDPVLPVFTVTKENFKYSGTAFYRFDKQVAIIKKMDDQIYQLIENDHYLKFLTIPKLSTTIGQVRSNIDIEFNQNLTSMLFKVKLKGIIEEYRGNKNILDLNELEKLNQKIQSYLEKNITELMKKMQELKVDPLQVGAYTLSPFKKPMSEKEWLHYWENMNITVDCRLELEPLAK